MDKRGGPAHGLKRTNVRIPSVFDPSPAQTCARFGVKRTHADGRDARPCPPRGPPVGDTSSPSAPQRFTLSPRPALPPAPPLFSGRLLTAQSPAVPTKPRLDMAATMPALWP